jgi:hypothetical protein
MGGYRVQTGCVALWETTGSLRVIGDGFYASLFQDIVGLPLVLSNQYYK